MPQTKETFISSSRGWADSRSHPAMAWMEKYTNAFDDNAQRSDKSFMAKWHTDDITHVDNGNKYQGSDKVFEAFTQIYAPFKDFLHEPTFLSTWETEDGWEMLGEAVVFADLPVPGREKVHEDMEGRKWDLGLSGMFHFWYIKDSEGPEGIKMKRSDVFCDTMPAVQEMLKRGIIKQ